MEELIDLLIRMGAEKVVFTDGHSGGHYDDDLLYFEYKGKAVKIIGEWHNDETVGIACDIYDKEGE